ncbi:MAG: hypothetical protein AW12_00385 [Candidatus Accumulibacter sp. BA-94]|nr:MAG: hypothetical protein AW12_00385 [Candidatus Accumulibacter sp. BA-94]
MLSMSPIRSPQFHLDPARLKEQPGIRPGGLRDALQMGIDLGEPAFVRVALGTADEQRLLVYAHPRRLQV